MSRKRHQPGCPCCECTCCQCCADEVPDLALVATGCMNGTHALDGFFGTGPNVHCTCGLYGAGVMPPCGACLPCADLATWPNSHEIGCCWGKTYWLPGPPVSSGYGFAVCLWNDGTNWRLVIEGWSWFQAPNCKYDLFRAEATLGPDKPNCADLFVAENFYTLTRVSAAGCPCPELCADDEVEVYLYALATHRTC